MLGPSKGIAHISYKGGGLCLPARSPYDRELLAEEVLRESHLHDMVQVLLDDDRWLVHRLSRRTRVYCVQCGRSTSSVCRSGARGAAQFCIGCAVGGQVPAAHKCA